MDNIEHYIDSDGAEVWKLNGNIHRDDGPAYITKFGVQVWLQYGNWHREDGPAIVYTDGSVAWCLDHRRYEFNDYCKKLNLTPEQILELKLKYG